MSRATEIIQIDQEGKVELQPPKLKYKRKLIFILNKLIKASKQDHQDYEELERQFQEFVENMSKLDVKKLSTETICCEIEDLFQLAKKINELRFRYIVDATLLPLFTFSAIVKMFTSKKDRPVIADLITTNLPFKTSVIDKKLLELAVVTS